MVHLATGLYVDDADLLTGFLTWTASILSARGVPAASLLPALAVLGERLRDFPRALRLLAAGTKAVREVVRGGNAGGAGDAGPGANAVRGGDAVRSADAVRGADMARAAEASRTAGEDPR
ncbi:hypothetical protein GA0115252_11801 [Streptomyces sp. DfronAA-171]|nr:hypothetical protein GA0115252_11801 [Streptomyces sp. DfronAA-171]